MEVKIDYNYDTAKVFKKFKRIPFIIYKKPIPKNDGYIDKNRNYYLIFNSKLIKEFVPSEKAGHKMDIYIYGGTAAFFGVFLPLLFTIGEDSLPPLWAYLLMFIPALFCLKITYNYWKKHQVVPEQSHMLLDRINSFITLPKIGDVEYLKIPFTHLRVSIHAIGGSATTYSGKKLWFYRDYSSNIMKRHNAYIYKGGFPKDPKQDWSFYVWYMDKNRPLPPGTAFDAYRDEDFERRKNEGFPPPLFKSLVPTPEATPAQQLVRETFWKDEDHIATEEDAHFSLIRRKPKKRD